MPDADRPADADVPTEPGMYLALSNGGTWGVDDHVLRVNADGYGDLWVLIFQHSTTFGNIEGIWRPLADAPADTQWGSRIPPSPRLAAMEELAAIDHVIHQDGRRICLACRASCGYGLLRTRADGGKNYGWRRLRHKPTCPWLRSQREKPKEDA